MRVLLVDDHALFREGLTLLLRPLAGGAEVLEAGTCEQACNLINTTDGVQLVLMDLGLPGMSGLDGIAWLHANHPEIPVVALSSSDDRETVLRALDSGALGFIPKSSSSAVMLAALQVVLARGIYLPPSVFLADAGPTAGVLAGTTSAPPRPQPLASGEKTPASLGITPRQAEVLDLLLQGKSTKVICRELTLSEGTVKAHTSAVLRALNVTTRTQAVVAASRFGWRFNR